MARIQDVVAAHGVDRYLTPLVAVGCAAGYAAVATAATKVAPLALFAVAVAATVVRAGRGPGLLAVALSVLVSDYLFLEPRKSLTLGALTAGLVVAYAIPVAVAGRRRVPVPVPVRA